MRRQTGNEFSFRDWMGAAGAFSTINNSMIKSEDQGIKREDRKKNQAILDATNKGVGVMGQGMTLDNTRNYLKGESVPATPDIVNQINEPGAEITMRTNKFNPATAEIGYQNAMKLDENSMTANTDKYVRDYKNQWAKNSVDDISGIDFSKQKNPLAARMAAGQLLDEYGKNEAHKSTAYTNRNKVLDQQFSMFSSGIIEADNAFKGGDKEVSRDILLNLINNVNNTSYKATKSGDGVKMHITYDGEDKHDDKDISIPDMIAELKNISKTKFTNAYHKNADFSRKLNSDTAKKPVQLINKEGNIIQAISNSEPLTSKVTWDVFDSNGKQLPINDLADARKAGYFNIPTKSGKTSKTPDRGKNYDALLKRVNSTVKTLIENNPNKWKYNTNGDVIDIVSGQLAGKAPYAAAILSGVKSGLIPKEEAAQLAENLGITQQDMQIAMSGKVVTEPTKHKTFVESILGTKDRDTGTMSNPIPTEQKTPDYMNKGMGIESRVPVSQRGAENPIGKPVPLAEMVEREKADHPRGLEYYQRLNAKNPKMLKLLSGI